MAIPVTLVLMFLAASVGIASGISVYYDFIRRDQSRASARMHEEVRRQERPGAGAALFKPSSRPDLDVSPGGRLPGDPVPEGAGPPALKPWRERMANMIAWSGVNITPRRLFHISVLAAGVLGLAGLLLHGVLLALVAAIAGGVTPLWYVHRCWKRRRQKFMTLLPSAFDLMARILRSGHSVPQSLHSVADSFEEPIASEFARCEEQQNLGLMPEAAYRDMAQRTDVLEMKIFVMAMLIQRQTGGNLSEVLERLAYVVRERLKLQEHVRTLTAEGRIQANVLMVMPVAMFFILRYINPSYTDILLENTTLMLAAGVSMVIGSAWVRQIVNREY